MTKKHVDTIIIAKHILPIVPRDALLNDYGLVIDKGIIIDIQPKQTCLDTYVSDSLVNLDRHTIMPGLINTHGHAAMTLFRGMADDLPLMDWLNDHIWPAESKWVSEQFVYEGTQLAIAEMLRSGTTCFSDMYFYPEMIARAASEIGIRAQVCGPILEFPTVWGTGPDDYLQKTLALMQEFTDSNLINIIFGPHAPYTVSDETFKKVIELADKYNKPIQLHLHETQFEVEESLTQHGARPIKRLADLGLFSQKNPVQCVHMTAVSDEDIEILQNSNSHVLHCPESNLKLASGFCEADKLLSNNINVSLGTDGAASNNDLDMFSEMRTAALIAKPVAKKASAIDACNALELATINGAKALGIEAHTGSLEIGKAADLIAIDMEHLNSQPVYNLQSSIVYSVNSRQVTDVWVAGKQLLNDSRFTTFELTKILKNADVWANKIDSRKVAK